MATTTTDDGFHEIQLNGKQLVFLFMAVTVVSVVIFLCGVLVGRGVRTERGIQMAEAATAEGAPNAETPPISATSTQSGPPATINETLTYRKQLDGPAPVDTLGAEKPSRSAAARPDAPPPAPAPAPETPSAPAAKTAEAPPPAPAPPAKAAAPPPAASAASAEPAGPGFAIQVAALRERTEAEAVVKRLTGKGYAAYVVAPAPGTAAVYRVRVGKFKERREANSVAARLQKEEQFKPWIVR